MSARMRSEPTSESLEPTKVPEVSGVEDVAKKPKGGTTTKVVQGVEPTTEAKGGAEEAPQVDDSKKAVDGGS